jgi:hypothetical protein
MFWYFLIKSHGVSLLFVLLATFLFISSDYSYALNVGGTNYEECIHTFSNYGYAMRNHPTSSTAIQRAQSAFNSNCTPRGFVYKGTHCQYGGETGVTVGSVSISMKDL